MADRLLLTPREKGKIRAGILGTINVIDFAREVSDRTAKTQLAKTKPIIDAEYWDLLEGVIMAKDFECEDKVKQERKKITDHLELLLKHSPLRSVSLRRELGHYIQALKEGK